MSGKHHAIESIRHAAHSAETELEHRGLPATARAVKVIGGATAAIGSHVRGWHGQIGGMMHGVLGRSSGGHRTKSRKRRSPAQIRATKRMLAAARRARGGRKTVHKHRRKKAHRTGSRKRRSPAQVRATKKMLAANRRARKGGKSKHRAKRRPKH